jgi:trehalose 6-phosphate phosphatase
MTVPLSGAGGRAALARLAEAPCPILFLDVDGTLAPLVRHPQIARTPWRTRSLLQRLRRSGAKVVLVSGRAARDAYRVVGHELDGILGNHGAELLKGRRIRRWIAGDSARIDAAAEAIADQLAPWPGVRLESKGHSVSLHHRLSLEERHQLMRMVRRALRGGEIVAMPGRQVIDIRAQGADKGTAVLRWLEREERGKVPLSDVVYAGDDTTDEDAFRALGPRAVTIAVGRRPKGAHFRTSTPVSLAHWLERLKQAR